MLTTTEKVLFLILALLSAGATYSAFRDMYRIISRGEGGLHRDDLLKRAWRSLAIFISQSTVLRRRPLTSALHVGVAWGFTFYFLVNLGDFLEGYVADYTFLGTGFIGDVYRLLADVLSVAVLVGVLYFVIRRLILPQKKELRFHDNVLLHPQVQAGAVRRDSLVVAFFILLHVGARFLGQSVQIAATGAGFSQPFASALSGMWGGFGAGGLVLLEHVLWWLALGAIALFTPYFPYTKHAHLFMAPLNYLTRPQRTSPGEMDALDFEDEKKEQFGAARVEHLTQTQIFDAFACIMCNRCQDVCPAYTTGKELSPSALEINKRYMIKEQWDSLASGQASAFSLLDMAISESAVWACTACGACIEACPVGNEPMHDILDIRRDRVLMEGDFPAALQNAFNGMERQGNPWQSGESRFRWANGLNFPVPTVEENPDFDVLYWTGCAVSYDPRAQLTARALVRVLHRAGVNFAVLGERENCTGDVARRGGNEALYAELAAGNVATLNEVAPKRIVVTCPHCLHNIGREYHQFGGQYEVVHHTELLDELIRAGKIPASAHRGQQPNVTFHDPCYLGRHNGVLDEPRRALRHSGARFIEMPRHGNNSFCCGAGGAQFWKEEEDGERAVNVERYQEAKATGAETLAVGCPFCMQMFETAKSSVPGGPEIKDVAELVAELM